MPDEPTKQEQPDEPTKPEAPEDTNRDGGGGDEPEQPESSDEKMLPQSQVNDLIGKTRQEAREAAKRQFLEEFGVDDTDALKESLTELQQLREERMSDEERKAAEIEKLQQDREKALQQVGTLEERMKQLEQQTQQRTIENAVLAAAAKANFADPADAVKFIDRSDIELTDDGTVAGVDDAIDRLAKEKAYLLRRDANRIAGPTNPERGGGKGRTNDERRATYFPHAGNTKPAFFQGGHVVSVEEE